MVTAPRLHAMSVSELIDTVFALYRRNFLLFAGVVAVLAIPQAILGLPSALVAQPHFSFTPGSTTTFQPSSYAGYGGLQAYGGLLGLIFGTLITGALATAISARYLGRPMSVEEAYRETGTGTFLRLVGAGLLEAVLFVVGIALVAGVLALVAVGLSAVGAQPLGVLIAVLGGVVAVLALIYAGVRLAFLSEAVVLDRTSVWGAFRRSWELVGGTWWRVFGIILLLGLIVGIISGIAGAFVTALLLVGGTNVAVTVVRVALTTLITILVQPIQLAGMVLLYYDLRIRKEGFDLEQMAQGLNVE